MYVCRPISTLEALLGSRVSEPENRSDRVTDGLMCLYAYIGLTPP